MKTDNEKRIEKILLAITEDKQTQAKLVTDLEEIHIIILNHTDNRQWKAIRLALYHEYNLKFDEDGFKVTCWAEFPLLDNLTESIVKAVKLS